MPWGAARHEIINGISIPVSKPALCLTFAPTTRNSATNDAASCGAASVILDIEGHKPHEGADEDHQAGLAA
jgi:hypothetical protein